MLCLCGSTAFAQNARSLTQISVSEGAPGEMLVTLDFDQAAPEARIAGNDTNRITVTLLSTSRGPAARYEGDPSSLLRDIVFTQESTSLLLTFVLAAKTNMEMTVDSPRRFAVKLTALERSTA